MQNCALTDPLRCVLQQKVDIYSLGIIFFEMCYKPLQTNMERVKVLGHLRTPDIGLPDDLDQVEMEKQVGNREYCQII